MSATPSYPVIETIIAQRQYVPSGEVLLSGGVGSSLPIQEDLYCGRTTNDGVRELQLLNHRQPYVLAKTWCGQRFQLSVMGKGLDT